jgi:hypothetical protein
MAQPLPTPALLKSNAPVVRGSQASQTITVTVAANGSSPVNLQGNQFYVVACNAPVLIQTYSGGSSGVQNLYGTAQGTWPQQNDFTNLQITNPNNFACVVRLWVGYDSFRNDQLTLINSAYSQVAYPTYPVANSASTINILDLSGSIFADVNGKQWGALQRVCIQCFNLDSGNTFLLYKQGGSGSSPAVGVIYPAPLPIRFDFSGNYTISSGSVLDMIVSEIYLAVPV